MSALHDLILALPEYATLEINQGHRDPRLFLLWVTMVPEQRRLATELAFDRAMSDDAAVVEAALDTKAAAILRTLRLGGYVK